MKDDVPLHIFLTGNEKPEIDNIQHMIKYLRQIAPENSRHAIDIHFYDSEKRFKPGPHGEGEYLLDIEISELTSLLEISEFCESILDVRATINIPYWGPMILNGLDFGNHKLSYFEHKLDRNITSTKIAFGYITFEPQYDEGLVYSKKISRAMVEILISPEKKESYQILVVNQNKLKERSGKLYSIDEFVQYMNNNDF